jgi:hypothetical protein
MNDGVLIPKFYLVSTNPDRVNTEDYLRKNLDLNTFYRADPQPLKNFNLSETTESPRLCVPKRRVQAEVPTANFDIKPQRA